MQIAGTRKGSSRGNIISDPYEVEESLAREL